MTLAGFLLDATVRVSVILAIGIVAAAMFRRRSAAVRHWILAAALLCAAAVPLVQLVVPAWGMSATNRPGAVLATISASDASVKTAAPIEATTPIDARRIVAAVWLIGAGVSVVLLAIGFVRLMWIASRSRAVANGSLNDIAADVARRYGIDRPVALLQSDHPTLLVTWGLRRPRILLPVSAPSWSTTRTRIVVGHELAHVQRCDWTTHMAAAIVRCVYWFNPLVWIACARLRYESEQACDDAVLNLGVEGTTYASELVDLARTFSAFRRSTFVLSPAPAMARPSSLERRVRAMLNARLNRSPITRAASAATALALIALTLPLAGFGAPQAGPGSFSGSLLDTIGRFMPNVPIRLTNVETAAKFEGRSDAVGRFEFGGLPAGDYEVYAEAPGFDSRFRFTLKAGQKLDQPVTLQLGSLEETVTIAKPTNQSAPSVTAGWRDDGAAFTRRPGPCDQSIFGGCIDPPTKIAHVTPSYPANATGDWTIVVQAKIGVDGRVKSAEGRLGAPADQAFVQATIDAVKEWRFTPTYVDGVPVEVDMKVTALFRGE